MSENGNGTAIVTRADSVARQGSALGGDRETFSIAVRTAEAMAASNMFPPQYHGNVANCLVALEYANRLGVSVLAVAQNLDLIHNRPALRSTFLIGTVNASKRFTPLRFRWYGTEGKDDWGCRAVATDKESGEECLGALITINMAKVEGWYAKNGSKYKTMPEQMLMYRAAAFWTRVFCPEITLGFATSEEAEDMPVPGERVQSIAAALDRPDAPPQDVPAEVVSSEQPDQTEPQGSLV